MTNITRSEYQKVVEENKRLMEDIRILTMPSLRNKRKEVFIKWKHYFIRTKKRESMLEKEAALRWIDQNKVPGYVQKYLNMK